MQIKHFLLIFFFAGATASILIATRNGTSKQQRKSIPVVKLDDSTHHSLPMNHIFTGKKKIMYKKNIFAFQHHQREMAASNCHCLNSGMQTQSSESLSFEEFHYMISKIVIETFEIEYNLIKMNFKFESFGF